MIWPQTRTYSQDSTTCENRDKLEYFWTAEAHKHKVSRSNSRHRPNVHPIDIRCKDGFFLLSNVRWNIPFSSLSVATEMYMHNCTCTRRDERSWTNEAEPSVGKSSGAAFSFPLATDCPFCSESSHLFSLFISPVLGEQILLELQTKFTCAQAQMRGRLFKLYGEY